MQHYRFDMSMGREIEHFGSANFVLSDVVHLASGARVSCFHLGVRGIVGSHQATKPQLLIVVQGEGLARGEQDELTPLAPGVAIFWDEGEWHEVRTQTGMTAIVIEGEGVQPSNAMPLVHRQ